MKQAVMNDMNSNPLYRKMRERFSVNGATIGEVMLMRAEMSTQAYAVEAPAHRQATVVQPTPVAVTPAKRERERTVPHFVKSHNVFFSCVALFLCAILLLAIIIPFLQNSPLAGDASKAMSVDTTSLTDTNETVTDTPEQAENNGATFANVMDAFQSSFGN